MKVLDNKRRRVDSKTGEEYIDLIGRTFEPRDNTPIKDFLIITAEEETRIDKVSMIAYGTPKFGDILLKFNSLSSTFELKEGDLILIPDLQFAEQFLKKSVEPRKPATFTSMQQKKNSTSSKVPTIDTKRIERLQKLASKYKNPAKNIQVPNLLAEGEKNISKKDGLIFFK